MNIIEIILFLTLFLLYILERRDRIETENFLEDIIDVCMERGFLTIEEEKENAKKD